MNSVVLMGRLTGEPDYKQESDVVRYTLAVDRRVKRDGEPTADFIRCVAFGKSAQFADRYFRKGMKVAVSGRLQTGSYTNREGVKVWTTDVIVETQEFCEKKQERASEPSDPEAAAGPVRDDGFMNIPDGIDEELPFA